jgi:hypothetical protein
VTKEGERERRVSGGGGRVCVAKEGGRGCEQVNREGDWCGEPKVLSKPRTISTSDYI